MYALQTDEPSVDAVVVKLPTAAKPTLNSNKEPERDMYAGVRFVVFLWQLLCADVAWIMV